MVTHYLPNRHHLSEYKRQIRSKGGQIVSLKDGNIVLSPVPRRDSIPEDVCVITSMYGTYVGPKCPIKEMERVMRKKDLEERSVESHLSSGPTSTDEYIVGS